MSAQSSRTGRSEQSNLLKFITYSPHWDEQFYLDRNPDVKSTGLNPEIHFLLYGGFEGRDPSRSFSTSLYLKKHPEVAAARINPLVHYELYGRPEASLAHSAATLN